MTPLVSIILPTYNRAARLSASIESCLCQTHPNIEIIIVDDGSTDDTRIVAEGWVSHDPRVRYFRQQNKKLPAALNAGHHLAVGDYITWTSDDNRYEPNAIEIMVAFLESEPTFGMVYCDMEKMGPDGTELGPYDLLDPSELPNSSCVGACFLYRRSVHEAIGDYRVDTFLAEDYDYWLRIFLKFPIKRLAGVRPYRYGFHKDSLTSRRQGDVIVQTAKVRCRHVIPLSQRRGVMWEAYWNAHWYHRGRHDWMAAWPCALACLRLRPLCAETWRSAFGTAMHKLREHRRQTVGALEDRKAAARPYDTANNRSGAGRDRAA